MTQGTLYRRAVRNGIGFLIAALMIFACILVYCGYRTHKIAQATALLRQNQVHVVQACVMEVPWYQRLPLVRESSPIRSVSLRSHPNLETIVASLAELGTVTELNYFKLTPRELRLISKLHTIEVICADWGGSAEEVRPFLSHRLKEYSVSGADHDIPPDALALLFSIPTLKRVGTAHGEHAVPKELQLQRPDVEVYVTDFPP